MHVIKCGHFPLICLIVYLIIRPNERTLRGKFLPPPQCTEGKELKGPLLSWLGQLGLESSQDKPGVTVADLTQLSSRSLVTWRAWLVHTVWISQPLYQMAFQKQCSTIPYFLTVMIVLISY